jgi:hypothetical protein
MEHKPFREVRPGHRAACHAVSSIYSREPVIVKCINGTGGKAMTKKNNRVRRDDEWILVNNTIAMAVFKIIAGKEGMLHYPEYEIYASGCFL